MITKKPALVVTFAVCALALAVSAVAQRAVERPFKISGHITMTVDLTTGDTEVTDWGEATHGGRFLNQGTGHMDLATGSLTGSGVWTAANGDQIFWESPETYVVECTGGTGRFENVTGGFVYVPSSNVVITMPDPNTMVVEFTYRGVGVITY